MEKLIKTLIESANPFTNRQREVQPLVEKWKRSGLLKNLEGYAETSLAILLENQAKELIKEVSMTGTAANSEQWHGIALPLIRRIFAEIAAKEFVSVQAMNMPTGLVFYLDYKYGTNKQRSGYGYGVGQQNQTGTVHGITSQSGAPSDGLYGTGRFGYSVNDASASYAITATASVSDFSEVNFDYNFSASLAAGTIKKISIAASSLTQYDPHGIRSFGITSGSATNAITYYPAFTKISGANIVFYLPSTAVTTGSFTGYVVYSKQPDGVNTPTSGRTDFEANRANDALAIPEIDLEMRSIPITAKSRKLKASWTPEFAQDLNAYHHINAESEVTSMLSEYVSMEIDLEILDMLIVNAITTEYWSAKIGTEWNGTSFQQATFTGTAWQQGTWFQTLGTKMQKVSNKIHQKTMRGGANFIVCSPDIATIIESIPGYAADTDGNKFKFAMGVQKVGAVNNRFQVYKNPYLLANTMLMGFRGSQFLETGAVYAPYIPLMLTPLVYDPTNFVPRRGVMTRYAKVVVRPEFYGKIYVADVDNY